MHVGAVSIFEGAPFFDDSGRFRLAETRRLVGVPAAPDPAVPQADHARCRSSRAGRSGSTTPASTSPTTCASPRCRRRAAGSSCSRSPRGSRPSSSTGTRPLWELWFVEGLEGGNVGLIQKTHHALVDGVSGVDVATVLLDFTPDPTFLEPPRWIVEPPPSPGRLLVDTIVRADDRARRDRAHDAPHRADAATDVRAHRTARPRARHARRPQLDRAAHVDQRHVGRRRRFEGVQISLDDVKSIRKSLGGTVNDVVLAGVAGGLRAPVRVARRRSRPHA